MSNCKKVVGVLAHLMDKRGGLGEESLARVEAAVEHDLRMDFDYFITSGWNYRDDTDLNIGEAVAKHLVDHCGIDASRVMVDTNARDTVGDAFFMRRKLRSLGVEQLFVVTSDYHVSRAELIFGRFFRPDTAITMIGASTSHDSREGIEGHEQSSVDAFLLTFSGVDFASDCAVLEALSKHHPLYKDFQENRKATG